MAEWTEKCRTCNKAGGIPGCGWSWACYDVECNYEPVPDSDTFIAMITVANTKE